MFPRLHLMAFRVLSHRMPTYFPPQQRRSLATASVGAAKSLFVSMASTPNPDSLKFLPEGREVLGESQGSGVHYSGSSDTRGSKLVRTLLKHGDITGVFLGRDFISVNKRESASWAPLKVIVVDAIMEAFAELDAKGVPILDEPKGSEDTAIRPEDSEVVAMIKELIETRIRPAVQEDGGDLFFESFEEDTGIVKVRMAGSCVGCPSSSATLRNGVENMLMHYIPEVKKIEQVLSPSEIESEKTLKSLEERLKLQGGSDI